MYYTYRNFPGRITKYKEGDLVTSSFFLNNGIITWFNGNSYFVESVAPENKTIYVVGEEQIQLA